MSAKIFSVDDARALAKRRMPRLIFDYIDGAAGSERAKAVNRSAFEEIILQPRVLVDVEERSLRTHFLGREWDLPFGVAPMGMCNIAWPHTDRFLAEAAKRHNFPLALSTMGSSTMEDVFAWSGGSAWFQLYVGQSDELAMELVDRAAAIGYETLIFTVDVPQVAPRLRDLRNGFGVPFRIGPRQFVDFALHPHWSLYTLSQGAPALANVPVSSVDKSGGKAFNRNAGRGRVDWAFLDRVRDRWPRMLVVKGVMSVDDALRIRAAGADGIYVSNHGGRQLASAPPAIQVLPRIRAAVGAAFPLLFDSGVRDGESIIKALALGADFVLLGRPFFVWRGAAGADGVEAIVELLRNEVSVTLAQLGRPDIGDVDRSVICDLAELKIEN